MRETPFFRQADLLVQVMPFVNAEACFALKGGTAINFFVRDFPRLSVDIDLVYLPLEDAVVSAAIPRIGLLTPQRLRQRVCKLLERRERRVEAEETPRTVASQKH